MQLTGRRVLEMRKRRILFGLALAMAALFSGCGGGDGSSGGSGTISMNITDSKPVLPVPPGSEVESITITFYEVSVHKSGGGWDTLRAVQQPFTIDLYQFRDGAETQFVPPVKIDSGKYTQVRIGVTEATIQIKNEKGEIATLDLEIPSENLKTDKNFEFEVPDEGAVDLTVDFDLSQSIVVTGNGTYQLKPVLHINETSNAATITGTINWGENASQATVTVTWDKYPIANCQDAVLDPSNDEEYTKITVMRDPLTATSNTFEIFWLVPNQGYFVKVESLDGTNLYYVCPTDLGPGAIFPLN
jgi:hypothetical protein